MENKVKELRNKRGMSVTELSRRAQTSRQTIYAIEKQEIKNISGPLMFRIADALDFDEREIFFESIVTHGEQGGRGFLVNKNSA